MYHSFFSLKETKQSISTRMGLGPFDEVDNAEEAR